MIISFLFRGFLTLGYPQSSLPVNRQSSPMPSNTLSLAGKVAIVTGSGRETGIGAAIATTLASNGARVTINHVSDASASRATDVAQNIQRRGGEATVVQADISTAAGAQKLVDDTLVAFEVDHIDILGRFDPVSYSSLIDPSS